MSDAHVKFFSADRHEASLGAERNFSFRCPKSGDRCGHLLIAGRAPGVKRDGQNQNGGRAMWTWNGNRERPTFSPSINCLSCWHGYIEDGRCVSVAKVDEPEPLS